MNQFEIVNDLIDDVGGVITDLMNYLDLFVGVVVVVVEWQDKNVVDDAECVYVSLDDDDVRVDAVEEVVVVVPVMDVLVPYDDQLIDHMNYGEYP